MSLEGLKKKKANIVIDPLDGVATAMESKSGTIKFLILHPKPTKMQEFSNFRCVSCLVVESKGFFDSVEKIRKSGRKVEVYGSTPEVCELFDVKKPSWVFKLEEAKAEAGKKAEAEAKKQAKAKEAADKKAESEVKK